MTRAAPRKQLSDFRNAWPDRTVKPLRADGPNMRVLNATEASKSSLSKKGRAVIKHAHPDAMNFFLAIYLEIKDFLCRVDFLPACFCR